MKKIIMTLLFCIIISINVSAKPKIELTNGGNCSYFAYFKFLEKGVDLPIKNNSLQQWQGLENKTVGNKIIRFSDMPSEGSLMLFTPEDLGVKNTGHIAYVKKVIILLNQANYLIIVEESGTSVKKDNYMNYGKCWYRYNCYFKSNYKNVKYITIEDN